MADASPSPKSASKVRQRPLLYLWAVGGVLLLLVQALLRLTPIALEAMFDIGLSPLETTLCAAWVVLNLYLEGYRGFQRRFVPRVVARAHYLATRLDPPTILLAPLFAMAYFHATKSARRAAFIVTGLVLLAITAVRGLPQPWRGIIDAGVVAGLGWGTLALLIAAARCLASGTSPGDPEVQKQPAEPEPPAAFLTRES